MELHESLGVVRICFVMNDLCGFSKGGLVRRDSFESWQTQKRRFTCRISEAFFRFLRAEHISHASHVAQVAHGFTGFQSSGNFQNGVFAHSESDQIGFGVQQDRTANSIAPEIVMSQASQ